MTWIKKISFDEECYLIKAVITEDDIGNQIPGPEKRKVLCACKSAQQSEFYSAAQEGIESDKVIFVNAYEYDGEEDLEYSGDTYKIYRRYARPDEAIELYVKRSKI